MKEEQVQRPWGGKARGEKGANEAIVEGGY